MYLRPACLLLLLLVNSSSLFGIELTLKNGDRLQGELVVETDHHFIIQHPILGEIEIAKSALAEMPEEPPTPKPEPKPITPQELGASAGPGVTHVEKPSKKDSPAKPEPGIKASPLATGIPGYVISTPSRFIQMLKRMNAKVGLSFSDRSSRRDQTDLRFFYNSKWKNAESEYRFDSDYRFSKTDGDTSQNRLTGNFRFRRQLQRNLFIQATSFYKSDPLREINNFYEQGFGGGWKQKVSQRFEYSLGGEASVKYEDLTAGNSAIGGTYFLTNFFQDSVFQINNNYQLIQEAATYVAPDDMDNWGYSFDLKLDGKITKGFTVRVGYEFSFDNIVPKRVPQHETLFSSSILYTF